MTGKVWQNRHWPKTAPSENLVDGSASTDPVDITNDGQRALLATGVRATEISRATGASKQSVSQWRLGHKIPSEAQRAKLQVLYGIDVSAWNLSPGAKPRSRPTEPTSIDPATMSTIDEIHAHQRRVLELVDDPSFTPPMRMRLLDVYTRALSLKVKMDERRETLEDRAVRESAFWKRSKVAILLALKPYPDAARAVAMALAAVDTEKAEP